MVSMHPSGLFAILLAALLGMSGLALADDPTRCQSRTFVPLRRGSGPKSADKKSGDHGWG